MKILIATESFYPNISGVAVFSCNLAKNMAQKGHEVFVVAPSSEKEPYIENKDGIKIFRLSSLKNPFRNGYYISKTPYRSVKELINEIQPDVVHLQDPTAISLSVLVVARKNKIPIVITNHFALDLITSYLGYIKPLHPLVRLVSNFYLGWFYNRANVLTCPSQKIADYFIKHKLRIKPIVISNGVDLTRFSPKKGDNLALLKKLMVSRGQLAILYVGRMDVDKEVKVLVRAMPNVLKKIPAHLILVGNGRKINTLKKMAKKLKIEKYVTFTGFIKNDNQLLPEIYQLANVFSNPCPIEAQGISVLEAMASGLPVVVANGGAFPEMISNGKNGYLFKPGHSADLATKLVEVLINPELAQKMGQKNLEIVQNHTVARSMDQFEKVYISVVKK